MGVYGGLETITPRFDTLSKEGIFLRILRYWSPDKTRRSCNILFNNAQLWRCNYGSLFNELLYCLPEF